MTGFATFLTDIGTFMTALFGGISSWATMAADTPLIILLLGVSVAGGVLALLIHFVRGV